MHIQIKQQQVTEGKKEFQKAEIPTEGHYFVYVVLEHGERVKFKTSET